MSNSGHWELNLALEVKNKASQAETWANALGLDVNFARNIPYDVVHMCSVSSLLLINASNTVEDGATEVVQEINYIKFIKKKNTY